MRYIIFLTKTVGYVAEDPYGFWVDYEEAKKSLFLDLSESKQKYASSTTNLPQGPIVFMVTFQEVTK